MKTAYLRSLLTPLDGMWEAAVINPSPHNELFLNDRPAGYFAADVTGKLLQFYTLPAFEQERQNLFRFVINIENVTGAVAATSDPGFLSLCLDVQKTLRVHTLLYQRTPEFRGAAPRTDDCSFRIAQSDELDRIVSFQCDCLGGDENLVDWLRGYSANLLARSELFVLEYKHGWIGLGECRLSDTQPRVADLGVMVAPDHRQNGWATEILIRLSSRCDKLGLHPVCSTTVENIGAQKAIERAGFTSHHRMMDVSF